MQPELYLPVRLSTRQATADDREAITAFLAGLLTEFDLALDLDGTDRDIAGIPGSYQGGYFGLIEDEGMIVGTYALFAVDDNTAEVRKMYLHPSIRGQGLGRQLLTFIEAIAANNGYEHLQLETSSAMTAARALYERSGYLEVDPESKSDRCDRRFVKRLIKEL